MAKYVAIKNYEGKVEIHLPHPTGNYDTLCNTDGDDPKLGLYPASVPKGAKVDCDECFRIWLTAKMYTIKDFAAPNKACTRLAGTCPECGRSASEGHKALCPLG